MTYEEQERRKGSRFGWEPPLPWKTVLAWPLLWLAGYVTEKIHSSLYEWEGPDDD